jgi:hypothetical protein
MKSKSLILNEIKSYYGFKKDADFARFLGITPQTLSNWKARDTFDPVLVYTKCVDLNPHWVLVGEGEMTKNSDFNSNTPTIKEGYTQYEKAKTNTTPTNKGALPGKNYTQKLHPTLHPTAENCKLCVEKERVISQQNEVIQALKKVVLQLEMRLDSISTPGKKNTG